MQECLLFTILIYEYAPCERKKTRPLCIFPNSLSRKLPKVINYMIFCTHQSQCILNMSINRAFNNDILCSGAIWRNVNNNKQQCSITASFFIGLYWTSEYAE